MCKAIWTNDGSNGLAAYHKFADVTIYFVII